MRVLVPVLLAIALISQIVLSLKVLELEEQNAALTARMNDSSLRLPRLETQLNAAVRDLTAQMNEQAPAPTSSPEGTIQFSPQHLNDQLLVTLTYQLEQVVNWIDVIERKLYFVAFPPPDNEEKQQVSEEIQARSAAIKARYQSLALGSAQLRELLTRSLAAAARQKPPPQRP